MKFLNGSIPDWDFLIQEAFRCLKPGGYLESMEPSTVIQSDDGSVNENTAFSQWGKIFIAGGKKSGRSFSIVEDEVIENAMRRAGFKDVKVWTRKASPNAQVINARLHFGVYRLWTLLTSNAGAHL